MVVRRNRPESVMTLKRYPAALLLRVSFFVLKYFVPKLTIWKKSVLFYGKNIKKALF